MKNESDLFGFTRKKPYAAPTVTRLTQEQARKLLVNRTGCSDLEATEVLESLSRNQSGTTKQCRKAG
jgi:hypothetical protein